MKKPGIENRLALICESEPGAWIGHPTARRALTKHGWVYEDSQNQALAFHLAMFKLNLPAIDAFIESMNSEDPVKDLSYLRRRRSDLYGAFARNSKDAVARHAEWLENRRLAVQRDSQILPLAEKGAKFTPEGGGPGKMRKLIRHELPRELKKHGNLESITPRSLWKVCKESKYAAKLGIEFFDNDAWIEGGGNVGFRRFSNILSEEKKALS